MQYFELLIGPYGALAASIIANVWQYRMYINANQQLRELNDEQIRWLRAQTKANESRSNAGETGGG